jgi:protein-tyrosine phosphatase
MWWNLGSKFIKGRWQKLKRSSISLNQRKAAYSDYNKVLFICEGNICRSPFAQRYLLHKKPGFTVASCGLQFQANKMSPLKALRAASESGIDLSSHRSAFIGDLNPADFDAAFVMDKNNYQKLAGKYPLWMDRVFFLDVENVIVDPYGGTDADFRVCYDKIKQLIDRHFSQ